MKIAHVIASLDARRGGPSRSSLGLARALAQQGHDVGLLTAGAERKSDPAANLKIETFPRGFPAKFSPSAGLKDHLRSSDYEVIHHHGLWLRPLHYSHREAASRSVPLVISPRGMMTSWAWNHHRMRKRFTQHLVHPGALENASGWHATSDLEAEDIRRLGFKQPICVTPNGVNLPSEQQLQIAREFWLDRVPELKNHRVGLFYSRLHSKKRVIELIDLWRKTAPPDWILLIVGIPDQFTVKQLESHVLREVGRSKIYVYDGTYQPPPYSVSNLFLLPSHSENFGLSVAEALAAGVPVLTTTATPWAEINERDAGWCVDYGDYDQTMATALNESSSLLSRRGALGRKWVQDAFTWNVVAERMHDFYQELLRGR